MPEKSSAKKRPNENTYVYDDDVYLRLQHGKGFHDLVYMSYIKHINLTQPVRHK
jgi:hypothetical protein